MLDKLKNLGSSAKQVFLFLVAPLLLLVAYIVYLIEKVRDLKVDVAQAKEQQKLTKTTMQAEEAEHEAVKEELNYTELRDAYLKSNPTKGGGQQGDSTK